MRVDDVPLAVVTVRGHWDCESLEVTVTVWSHLLFGSFLLPSTAKDHHQTLSVRSVIGPWRR